MGLIYGVNDDELLKTSGPVDYVVASFGTAIQVFVSEFQIELYLQKSRYSQSILKLVDHK